jgi:hypothetical protein
MKEDRWILIDSNHKKKNEGKTTTFVLTVESQAIEQLIAARKEKVMTTVTKVEKEKHQVSKETSKEINEEEKDRRTKSES